MTKKRRKKSSAGGSKRRSNPHGRRHTRRAGHRRRNPQSMSIGGTGSILKSGFFALLGLVIARQVPQLVLGAKNTGWMGYLGNIVTTFLAAWAANMAKLGPGAARDVAIGGGLYTVNRLLSDNFSPVGKLLSLSGIGDPHALGDIQSGYFPLPVPTNAMGQPIIPAEIRSYGPPAALPAGSGMSGINASTRYTSRFN